jgi:hypothetical protein
MPLISGGSALPTGASTLTSSATATGTIVSTFESASFTESGPPVYTTPSSCRIDPPVYTTAFVPPKDCSLQYSPYSSTNNNVNTTLFLSHNVLSASCYPSGWYPYCVELLTITPLYFYSPKSCPDGYAAATTQFDIETTSGTSTTTTILGCCERYTNLIIRCSLSVNC